MSSSESVGCTRYQMKYEKSLVSILLTCKSRISLAPQERVHFAIGPSYVFDG